MNLSKLLAATACVAALTAVSTSAFAAPAPGRQYEYRVGPPPSNPHDVFRPVIRTAKPRADSDHVASYPAAAK